MKRQFSQREQVMLIVLALLLAFCLYYLLVDQPVRETIADSAQRQALAEDQYMIGLAKLSRMQEMQQALDGLDGSVAAVPDYDNAQKVVILLNQAMSLTTSYDLSFRPISISEQIVCRVIDMNFTCDGYQAARQVLSVLHDSPYRCDIDNVVISDSDQADERNVRSVETGEVRVSLTVTFFEYIPLAD